jgi:predicted HAD superfamily Cof-like phosphohydrolase
MIVDVIRPDKEGIDRLLMEDFVRDVVKFHERYGINYDGKPRQLTPTEFAFRLARTEEEVKEWVQAKSLAEQLDALLDLIYIVLGTAHLQGFTPEIIYKAWGRIQAANMAKERSSVNNPGKYGDKNDIVKPKGWKAPNHEDLVS